MFTLSSKLDCSKLNWLTLSSWITCEYYIFLRSVEIKLDADMKWVYTVLIYRVSIEVFHTINYGLQPQRYFRHILLTPSGPFTEPLGLRSAKTRFFRLQHSFIFNDLYLARFSVCQENRLIKPKMLSVALILFYDLKTGYPPNNVIM